MLSKSPSALPNLVEKYHLVVSKAHDTDEREGNMFDVLLIFVFDVPCKQFSSVFELGFDLSQLTPLFFDNLLFLQHFLADNFILVFIWFQTSFLRIIVDQPSSIFAEDSQCQKHVECIIDSSSDVDFFSAAFAGSLGIELLEQQVGHFFVGCFFAYFYQLESSCRNTFQSFILWPCSFLCTVSLLLVFAICCADCLFFVVPLRRSNQSWLFFLLRVHQNFLNLILAYFFSLSGNLLRTTHANIRVDGGILIQRMEDERVGKTGLSGCWRFIQFDTRMKMRVCEMGRFGDGGAEPVDVFFHLQNNYFVSSAG